jgi:hypothetical protein
MSVRSANGWDDRHLACLRIRSLVFAAARSKRQLYGTVLRHHVRFGYQAVRLGKVTELASSKSNFIGGGGGVVIFRRMTLLITSRTPLKISVMSGKYWSDVVS